MWLGIDGVEVVLHYLKFGHLGIGGVMCKTPLTIDVHVLAEKSYSHNDDDNPAADNDAAFTQRLLQFVNRKKIKLFFTIFF